MTAESYRDHAAECLQLSTKMTDPHSRSVLRAMAIAWADLAEQAERKEAAEQPPSPSVRSTDIDGESGDRTSWP